MPLDDREQRILAEIERQFYEEDPDLAHAVRNIDRSARFGLRFPVVGIIGGTLLLLLTYQRYSAVALIGFAIVVLSATALIHGIRARRLRDGDSEVESSKPWSSRLRRGWPFRRS